MKKWFKSTALYAWMWRRYFAMTLAEVAGISRKKGMRHAIDYQTIRHPTTWRNEHPGTAGRWFWLNGGIVGNHVPNPYNRAHRNS